MPRRPNDKTERQQRALAYIRGRTRGNDGEPPSMQEIATRLGVSISTVSHDMDILEAAKKITRDPNQKRSIRLVEEQPV
jgi:DNA-binding MarR family transcriptional regulator